MADQLTAGTECRTGSGLPALQRCAAAAPLLIGAAGSVGFTLYAGRNNRSVLLMILFAAWVVSPFIALAWLTARAVNWRSGPRRVVSMMTPSITLASLALLGLAALGRPTAKPAFLFLAVPAASWLILGVAGLSGELSSRRV